MKEKVQALLKQAMINKDSKAVEAYRAIITAFTNAEKSSGEVSDAEYINICKKMVAQRYDSAKIYADNGRADLATTEHYEANIINQFVPEQLSREEVSKIVVQVIVENDLNPSMKNMGTIVKLVNSKTSGRTDGKTISDVVKEIIAAQTA